jgi:hypothetical protein
VVVDWIEIERTWFEAVVDAIVATSAVNPTEHFYVGAFWLVYGDYSSLRVPVFGLNSESHSDPDVRWHPPEWRWSIIDLAHERVEPLYRPMLTLDGDEPTYEALWDKQIEVLARISRRVTRLARSHQLVVEPSALTPGFFLAILDHAQGREAVLDHLRCSVDEESLQRSGILDAVRGPAT